MAKFIRTKEMKVVDTLNLNVEELKEHTHNVTKMAREVKMTQDVIMIGKKAILPKIKNRVTKDNNYFIGRAFGYVYK